MSAFVRTAFVVAMALLATLSTNRLASADAADFLASFSGEWRGSGEARENPKADLQKIRCSLKASFDASSRSLTTSGKCGTTQGTRSLDGRMTASGNSINGNLFSELDKAQILSQRSTLQGDVLISEASYRTANEGKLIRTRTSLRKPSGGSFTVKGQIYDDAARRWVEAADVTFSKR